MNVIVIVIVNVIVNLNVKYIDVKISVEWMPPPGIVTHHEWIRET